MFLVNTKKCLRIFDEVYVSSDSLKIRNLAEKEGAIPIKRSKELCGDTPNIPVYQHALEFMGDADIIVAVQANSPTLEGNTIAFVKHLMEMGASEVMTCHENYKIYGSVWAVSRKKLEKYDNPYDPQPDVLVVDPSVDIHLIEDYINALCQ